MALGCPPASACPPRPSTSGPKLDLFELARTYQETNGGLEYLVCDEAQFYTPAQVEQLARIVDELNADVHALGLLTDFRGRLFEGSARFLELADERQELQVEARCWCGARATQNARLVNGRQVYDGEVVVVGDTGGDAEVVYELLCRRHWLRGETGRRGRRGELVEDAPSPTDARCAAARRSSSADIAGGRSPRPRGAPEISRPGRRPRRSR